jgi:APA family basic amino acid/polyamine antiporter
METPPATPHLERVLGLRSTFFIVTGSVIGSGVFLVASDIANAVSSPFWGLSTWVVAGFISFLGGLIFAELGTRFPKAGGQYVYLSEALHPLFGFLFGWTLILVVQAGSIAAVTIAFARFFSYAVEVPLSEPVIASVAVVGLTAINFLGIRKGAVFLDTITAIKILAILTLAAMGLFFPGQATGASLPSLVPSGASFGVALIAAFWAFDGWNNLGFVAGEIRKPKRAIPLGLGLGIIAITMLYILVNLTYFKFLSVENIAGSSFVAADAVGQMLGPRGVAITALLVAISALGCAHSMVLTGARVIYAMARDGRLPKGLARLNPRNHSPNAALFAQMVWTLVLVWSGSYDQLFTYVIFAAFLFYGLSVVALFVLRRKPLPPGQEVYLTPFYPILPILYLLFTVVFTLNALIEKPWESIAGLGLVALGIPAYWYFTRHQRRKPD